MGKYDPLPGYGNLVTGDVTSDDVLGSMLKYMNAALRSDPQQRDRWKKLSLRGTRNIYDATLVYQLEMLDTLGNEHILEVRHSDPDVHRGGDNKADFVRSVCEEFLDSIRDSVANPVWWEGKRISRV